jgi:glycosyltransferase involved in cell wall biosynthesis
MLKGGAQRFVVVSGYFPPVVGGTSTVMRNLLAAFRPETFRVVAESPGSFDGEHNAPVPTDVRVERVGVPAFVTRKIPYGLKLARWLRFGMIPRIEAKILATPAEAIVAVYPSWPFLIAAYRAHLRSGAPLFTYYMDVSAEAPRLAWPDRPAVQHYERRILQAARQRLVLSAAIGEDFQQRFGLDSVVIPHTIDPGQAPAPVPPARLASWREKRLIVHTGVVEGLQRTGLLRLARLIEAHPEWNARLVLSTPTSSSDLRGHGFDLPSVEIGTFTSAEVAGLQQAAHILVAVLPFDGSIEAYQRTAFPTKVTEYMAAGVPILAHAPPGSYFARHVQAHGYALLAGEANEASLGAAVAELLDDQPLRERLVRQARVTVESEFAVGKIAPRFAEACGIDLAALR